MNLLGKGYWQLNSKNMLKKIGVLPISLFLFPVVLAVPSMRFIKLYDLGWIVHPDLFEKLDP